MSTFPRLYKPTAVTAGPASVSIKQVLGSGNSDTVSFMQQVIVRSQALLSKLIILPRDWTRDDVFKTYFNPAGGLWADAEAKKSEAVVFANLRKVYWGIVKAHSVKVADLGSASGYVSPKDGGGYGDIHIHERMMSKEWGNSILTYVHEASHKFAATKDHEKRGYIDGTGKYKAPGLTADEALVNADSYAWFVWNSATPKERYENAPKLK